MNKFLFLVEVTCDTEEQANTVIANRIDYDDCIAGVDGDLFQYTIDSMPFEASQTTAFGREA